MKIEFREKDHTYFVNGEIAGISVTALLRKHGLAPDYSNISKAVLDNASNIGVEVHKDLENVLNIKDYTPTTYQGEQYAEYVKNTFDCGVAEQMLAYEYNGMIIAGTADVMAIGKNGNLILADQKNTSKFHREYVSWQVSLLDYFARKLNGEKINGNPFNWKGASEFYCYHYNTSDGGKMSIKPLEKIDDKEIERLLECEYNGEIYTRKELFLDKDFEIELQNVESLLVQKELEYKVAQESSKKMREQLLDIMKKQGIKSWENEKLKVTYVEEVDKMLVNSKRLKEIYPLVYKDCLKVSKQKASVRITIRGEESDDL